MFRIGLVLLLAGAASAQVSEADVRTAFAEARSAVQNELGRALEPVPALTFTTAAVLGRRVAEENLAPIRLRQSDPEKAAREAELRGEAAARITLAKYSWSAKEFLVALETWNLQARAFENAKLDEDGTVRAILVHEIVHALASAEAYLGVARELSHLKDERMKRGVNRILSSSYATLDCEDFKGELFQKRMKSGHLEFDALALDLQRGPLILETIFSNEPIEREEHVALVRRLLDSVRER